MTFLYRLIKRVKFSLKQKSKPKVTPNFLEEQCTLFQYDDDVLKFCDPFDYDHKDLNEFFSKDLIDYTKEFMGKTYCFTLDSDPKTIIAAFTVSNDSIKTTNLPNARRKLLQKEIPRAKEMRSYPAVLIGRLGINCTICRQGVGCEVMDFIKSWFVDPKNKTGCRFVVVDAYNEVRPLKFFEKNKFSFLFSTEYQEKEYLGLPIDATLKTRLMYFDLIKLKFPNQK